MPPRHGPRPGSPAIRLDAALPRHRRAGHCPCSLSSLDGDYWRVKRRPLQVTSPCARRARSRCSRQPGRWWRAKVRATTKEIERRQAGGTRRASPPSSSTHALLSSRAESPPRGGWARPPALAAHSAGGRRNGRAAQLEEEKEEAGPSNQQGVSSSRPGQDGLDTVCSRNSYCCPPSLLLLHPHCILTVGRRDFMEQPSARPWPGVGLDATGGGDSVERRLDRLLAEAARAHAHFDRFLSISQTLP